METTGTRSAGRTAADPSSNKPSVWATNVARNLGPNTTILVAVSYLVDCAVLEGFALTGAIPHTIPLLYLVAGIVDITTFYVLAGLVSPSSRRDGFLAAQRLIVSAAIQVTFMALAPPVALYFLTTLFLVFAFGSMGMSGVQGLFCWMTVIAAVGYLLERSHGMNWFPQESATQRVLVWVFFAVMMGRAATIGSFGRTLALKLRKRSDALAATRAKLEENLSGVLMGVRHSAATVATAARELNSGVSELATRTEQQAANLKGTASSMRTMTSMVNQNADNAKLANQQAQAAREKAERGGVIVRQTVTAMEGISVASNKIADIISVIDELAFQTNLLALNAAVEAARAGDQGRGFAVVASEVRNLAHRSATAAKQIAELISDSVAKVGEGGRLVRESGQHLGEIESAVKDVSKVVGEIMSASQLQSMNAEEIGRVVVQMDESTQRDAAMVHEASAAASRINNEADHLMQLTAHRNFEEGTTITRRVE
jgi:hypothetical protein